MKTYRRVVALGLIVAAALAAAGCQTVSGMGKDITAASNKTQEWITGDTVVE